MTEFEKDIYNKYLKISRQSQNKPYKTRLNFENFENEENYIYTKKLAIFFKKYNHIKIEDFFFAPYYIYPKCDKPYDLKFYSSYNGVKVYNLYEKKLLAIDPDTDVVLQRTKDGIKFIMSFCKDKNIKYSDYFNDITDKVNSFWVHLKENKINIYCLFLCNKIDTIYGRSDKEIINFMLGNLMHDFNLYRSIYYNSKITKKIISELKPYFSI